MTVRHKGDQWTQKPETIKGLKEEIRLLKIERDSALQSQKDSFEEQEKQIQAWKEKTIAAQKEASKFLAAWEEQDKQIQELKRENEKLDGLYLSQLNEIGRLQGKVKEALDHSFELRKISMADDEMAKNPNAGIIYRETVRKFLDFKDSVFNENLIK